MTTFLGKAGVALAIGGILGAGAAAGFGIASAVSGPPAASTAGFASTTATDTESGAPDLGAPEPGALGSGALGFGSFDAVHPRAGEYPALRRLLARRVEHGEVTVKGKDDKPVVVDVQRGQVTAVSPTSISLKSEDGFTATYTVNSDTKIRVDGERKAIGDVRVGNNAGLIATKEAGAATARFVVVR